MLKAVDDRNQKEFEQAALEHLEALYGYAMSLARNPADAEDLVQETYLRCARAARQTNPTGDLKPWLFTILRNLWINQWRRQIQGPEFLQMESTTELPEGPAEWMSDETLRPDALLERQILREEIRAAIESLPEAFREAIVLRCIEGFSYNQIAQILDCPAGTVMSRISRARAELRRRLSSLTGEQAKEAAT
jgi:RNA polymerase sigma-70 factor (ECF subfamily)